MRFHLNIHFLKIGVKNPKLNTNQYKLMTHKFIKGVIKALKMNLKIIYIDESIFQLKNNNYYTRRKKNEDIKKEIKDRLNLILAVDDSKVISYKLTKDSIDHNIFIGFLEDMTKKSGEKEIREYLIVIDMQNITYIKML